MKVLVTGGTGYIGSHTSVELINSGYDIVIVDNLSNSKIDTLEKIKEITGKEVKFYQTDILDEAGLGRVFSENNIDAVIHFAGLKAVGEFVAKPIEYYTNNVSGTLTLLRVMQKHNVNKLVFSSSATVYGDPNRVPITEDMPLSTTNPYGATKLMIEDILRDLCKADKNFKTVILRYFNPIGAHSSGLIGENPNGIPNNLMPYISRVASGKLEELNIFGNDYNTVDGTGVRDYIHVADLAKGHLKALEKLDTDAKGALVYNLGTGKGVSVLEMVNTFQDVIGRAVKYKVVARRPGDIAMCYADVSKAYDELSWKAEKTLEDMLRDSWNFENNN